MEKGKPEGARKPGKPEGSPSRPCLCRGSRWDLEVCRPPGPGLDVLYKINIFAFEYRPGQTVSAAAAASLTGRALRTLFV